MELSITLFDEHPLVEISGAVDGAAAGSLYDALVDCVGEDGTTLTVDLSHVSRLTHAGVRGLIVAAKLLRSRRGEMRIRGADQSVEAFLQGLGFNHLVRFEDARSREVTRTRLRPASAIRKRPPILAGRLRPPPRRVNVADRIRNTAAVLLRDRRRLLES